MSSINSEPLEQGYAGGLLALANWYGVSFQ